MSKDIMTAAQRTKHTSKLSVGTLNDKPGIFCDEPGYPSIIATLRAGVPAELAAHIVRCVNAHDELVEALRWIVKSGEQSHRTG